MRLRVMAIRNLLRQAVGWFDNKDSSPGCLTTQLARDAPVVKAVCVINRLNHVYVNYNIMLNNKYITYRPVECEPVKFCRLL